MRPSHGQPFTGLQERVAPLTQHHNDHFADVHAACAAAPHSAAALLPVLLTRALDMHQLTIAMGESIAQLHALASMGKLVGAVHGDGVTRFALVA